MLEMLADRAKWLAFFEDRRAGGHLSAHEESDLRAFIEHGEYADCAARILAGEPLPLPTARVINKRRTGKKRTVFIYPREERYALKLLSWGLSKYDGAFSPELYSFRKGVGARQALAKLRAVPGIEGCWVYKADVHDYFNSVDVDRLLPMLSRVISDDPELFSFIARMLREPMALRDGAPAAMQKGIMAGTPISPFLANVYLSELDRDMAARCAAYARYSDDIIIFTHSEAERDACAARIQSTLAALGLSINPDKEFWSAPGEAWTFLGFTCAGAKVDVAPASVDKLKGKMRRKARALMRWRRRKGKTGGQAARAFIRHFNHRLYENPAKNELTWARWYFPTINTDESLRALDHYMQDCVRTIAAGHHGKKRYTLRYGEMRRWGYRPLVHAFYASRQ